MDMKTVPAPAVTLLVSSELQFEIEQFLYLEAQLLDELRHEEWFALLADDIHYWMPLRLNRARRERDQDITAADEMASFDDDKQSMYQRIFRLGTGKAWSEEPPSRTRHLISNVRVNSVNDNEFGVRSNFIAYRSQGETEWDIWAGEREDLLRKLGDGEWQVARRRILLDQATILSKNISIFF